MRGKAWGMIDRVAAEEHLRVIRSLMEKATIYRTVSAEGALIGGALSLITAVGGAWLATAPITLPHHWCRFELPWAAVFVMTTAVNLFLLRRDAAQGGEEFVSQRMLLAVRGMLPAMLGGGLCLFLQPLGGWAAIASLWVLFYGISLLAASHFAPRSICWLGRAFFAVGGLLIVVGAVGFQSWQGINQTVAAHWIMGATFGLLHLVYAACTWPRKRAGAET